MKVYKDSGIPSFGKQSGVMRQVLEDMLIEMLILVDDANDYEKMYETFMFPDSELNSILRLKPVGKLQCLFLTYLV